jgi:hypothetical protein
LAAWFHSQQANSGWFGQCLSSPPRRSSPGGAHRWWTIDEAAPEADPRVAPLLQRALHILMTSLELRLPPAWKSLQLSVVMLWNAAVQSREARRRRQGAALAHASPAFGAACLRVCVLQPVGCLVWEQLSVHSLAKRPHSP